MSSPKSDHAIALVKKMIATGQLKPGDRLPNEDEFSAQLGISRNSMREAVRALQAMQVLVARQGDGTYVSSLEPSDMIKSLNFAVDVAGPAAVVNFLDVRKLIEVHAAEIAAIHRSESDLRKLVAIHERVLRLEDPEVLIELDSEFHQTIAAVTNNPVLSALLRVVSGPTMRARIWRFRHADQNFGALRREHGVILDAIQLRDVDAARYAMWSHVSGVQKWVEANPESLKAMERD